MRILDTFVVFDEREPRTPQNVCDQFLKLLSGIYPLLDRPENDPYDWMERAKTTLRHISRGKQILRHDFGDLYVHPYVEAEYPDSMVQMSLIAALHGYGAWRGRRVPLADRLSRGMRRFFDSELKTLFAHWSFVWPRFALLAKGKSDVLVQDGKPDVEALRRHALTLDDLRADMRTNGQLDNIESVKLATLERSGQISIVARDANGA